MTTLAEKLAARAVDKANKTDPVTPPVVETPPVEEPTVPVVEVPVENYTPEVTPMVEPTPAFQEQPAPAEPVPEVAVNDSNEIVEFKSNNPKKPAVIPPLHIDTYRSPTGSRRGYQWESGILKADAQGIYKPGDLAEDEVCEELVARGLLVKITDKER